MVILITDFRNAYTAPETAVPLDIYIYKQCPREATHECVQLPASAPILSTKGLNLGYKIAKLNHLYLQGSHVLSFSKAYVLQKFGG